MKIDRSFFERDTLEAARELIGKKLVRRVGDKLCSGYIVEAEAYLGELDAAAHSYKGRTERVRALYGEKGHAYIYLIYGMHCCLNISSGGEGVPECILIRAVEPCDGIDVMCERRNRDKITELCSGPGKLCAAFDITRELYGTDLCSSDELWIEDTESLPYVTDKRIGVDYAGDAKDYPWRFLAENNKFVSKPVTDSGRNGM